MPESDRESGGIRAMRVLTLLLGALSVFLFAWVAIARFLHPVDAEWMVGSVREAVDRAREGKPIYGRPSVEFISFLYPPVYYWVAGALSRFCSTFAACKILSLAGTGIMAWGIARLAGRLGASRYWTAVAVLLHLATYPLTLYFFDLERVDAFAASIVMLGLVVLTSGRDVARTAIGGALLGVAFFAKQAGLLAFVAAIVGLAFSGEKKRAGIALAAGGAVFAIVFAYLEVRTGGWFRYYCMKLPGTHGVEAALLTTFFVEDVSKSFALAAATAAILGPLGAAAIRKRGAPEGFSWEEIVFACVLAAGLVGAFFFRSHRGGWANVIVTWTPFACVAAAMGATRAEARAKGTPAAAAVAFLLLSTASLQFLALAYDPNDMGPSSRAMRDDARFKALVAKLEQQGEVVVTTLGNVTKVPHFHAAALHDVLRAGDPAPAEYLEGLRSQRYAALVVGAPSEFRCESKTCDEVTDATLQYYFVAARLEETPMRGLIGFDGRPRWILRPRRKPLAPMKDKELDQRVRAEAGLAEMRRWAAEPGTDVLPDDAIEELAAQGAR